MVRGLDGFLIDTPWRCAVLKDREGWSLVFSGGFGEGETPLPIPNRAVKPLSADGTWPARAWESRTPPVYLHGPSPAGAARRRPGRKSGGQRHAPVRVKRPVRVVRHLPGVSVRVYEHGRVAAPEGLPRLASDRPAGGARLLDHLVHLGGRAHVVGQRHPAPAAPPLNAAVISQARPVPQRETAARQLEKPPVVAPGPAAAPADPFIERACSRQVARSERDDAQ